MSGSEKSTSQSGFVRFSWKPALYLHISKKKIYPDGVIRSSRVPGSPFFLIRTALFGPAASPVSRFPPDLGLYPPGEPKPSRPPGVRSGTPDERKRGRARSVGERTREPHFLVANPRFPSPRCSVAAGTTPRQSIGRFPALRRPTSHQPIFRRPACRLPIFCRRATPSIAPH
jgi:hypothetical protein